MNQARSLGASGPFATALSSVSTRDDRDAFEAAIGPVYPGLVRRLTMVLGDGDDARDIAQDACLKAYRAWPTFDGVDARAWLHTIGLRLAFNHLRRRRRWTNVLRHVQPSPSPVPSDSDLWEALQTIEPRARAALILNVVEGYTQAEIATILGVPAGTVASWLSRARTSLRTRLASAETDTAP